MKMKKCLFCDDDIQEAATLCRHCYSEIARNVAASVAAPITIAQPGSAWSPGVAAVLSLVIPGAGQIYKGQILNGLVWLVFVVVGYVMLILPGLFLHVCCIVGAASGDPYAGSRRGLQTVSV